MMKTPPKQLITVLSFISILIIISCNSRYVADTESFSGTELCNADTTHKYSVYTPSGKVHCKNMPLVLILDPHGSGSYAINHFISTAEQYKCVLVASHLIRNNYSGFAQALEMLITDSKLKFPTGNKIYLAGFSGGARMALTFARNHRVDGILACGALETADHISALNTEVFAIAGTADFNFPEVASFILNTESTPSNLKIELTSEMHQWPSEQDISRAMGFLILSNEDKKNYCNEEKEALGNLSDLYRIFCDSLYKHEMLINAALACNNVRKIRDIPLQQYFSQLHESIQQDERLNQQLTALRNSLQFEFKVRDAYFNALKVRDKQWWTNEIADLDIHISDSKDAMMKNAYRRIKAFLGIVCYSITNNALRADDLGIAAKTLEIYRLLEPENPDMYYFSALYALKTGNESDVHIFLRQAMEAGFSATDLLKNDFTEKFVQEMTVR